MAPSGDKTRVQTGRRITETSRQAIGTPQVDHATTTESPDRVALSVDDLRISETLLIRAIQAKCFHKEVSTLLRLGVSEPNSIHELKEKSTGLLSLSPFLDEDGIMRVGGRLGKSKTIPYDHKHPIIMPSPDEEVTQALIRH